MEKIFSNENLAIAFVGITFVAVCLMLGYVPGPIPMAIIATGGAIGGMMVKYFTQKKTAPNQTTPPVAAKKQPLNNSTVKSN